MTFDDDEIIFDSGKRVYCFAQIVGLGTDGQMSYGYDGCFNEESGLSAAETLEIAEFMIAAWVHIGNNERTKGYRVQSKLRRQDEFA